MVLSIVVFYSERSDYRIKREGHRAVLMVEKKKSMDTRKDPDKMK